MQESKLVTEAREQIEVARKKAQTSLIEWQDKASALLKKYADAKEERSAEGPNARFFVSDTLSNPSLFFHLPKLVDVNITAYHLKECRDYLISKNENYSEELKLIPSPATNGADWLAYYKSDDANICFSLSMLPGATEEDVRTRLDLLSLDHHAKLQ